MQKFKKFIAVFVTMVMVMATGVVGFGATQGKAKLTVNLVGNEASTLSGTLNAYRLMNWDAAKNTYTINNEYLEILKQILGMNNSNADQVKEKIAAMKDNSQDVKKLAEDLHTSLKNQSIDNNKETITIKNGNGSTLEDGIPLGYYFLDFETGDNVQRGLFELTEDRTVALKTQEIIFTKDIDSYTHEMGETVTYTITTQVPKIDAGKKFEIKDEISEGLKYLTEAGNNNLKVNVTLDGGNTEEKNVTVLNNNTFTLDLKEYLNVEGNKGKKLTITYKAIVTDKSKLKESNKAILSYDDKEPIDDSEDTFTYPLYIRKIGEEANLLDGAKFELYEQGKDTNRKVPLINVSDGEYRVDRTKGSSNDVVSAVTVKNSLGNPNEKYNLKINGLRGDKEYLLVETEAPAGYNKLADPIKITIKTDVNNRELWNVKAVNGKETSNPVDNIVEIENNKGGLLPETGGMGTIIFTIVGLGLILAALGMRKTKKEQ